MLSRSARPLAALFAAASLLLLASPALAQTPPSAPPPGLVVAPVGSAATVDVSAYFQPFGDAETVAIQELARAKKWVHIAHYNIRNAHFFDALLALKNRGVDVQIATDEKEANQPWNTLTAQFVAAGFDVVKFTPPAGGYAIMHLKATIIDGETVMTGSYNWNNTAQLSNDENMLVIRDASVAAEYERFFQAIRSNTVTSWRPQLAAGSPIEVHFSPADHPSRTITSLIDAAQDRVTVAVFALMDRFVAASLKNAAARGVTVEVVTEQKEASKTNVASDLAQNGCRVIVGANTASAFSAMHHKYAVVDDTVVSGACNWTKTAFLDSCEDVIVIRDAALARAYRHNWKALVKRYDAQSYDPFQFLIATPTAHLQFCAKHDRTAWGDQVYVTGNRPELGNWDVSRAVALRTSDDCFPKWSASVELPAGTTVEYKYVTVTARGEVFWEDGGNRTFTVDPEGTDEARDDEYRFPAPPPAPAAPAAPAAPVAAAPAPAAPATGGTP